MQAYQRPFELNEVDPREGFVYPGPTTIEGAIMNASRALCNRYRACVAARPDTDVDGINGLSAGKGMVRDQVAQGCVIYAPLSQGRVQAAPAAAMDRSQAEVDGREGRPDRQEGIGEVEQGVGAPPEAGIECRAELTESMKGS